MGTDSQRSRTMWVACAILAVCWAGPAPGLPHSCGFQPALTMVSATFADASAVAPYMHRLTTRLEHTMERFLMLIGNVGMFWLWTAVSLAVFLIIAAFSSVIDRRMLALRNERPGALGRYLGYGVRTFFLIVIDRRTPYTARLLLAAGLLYWLVPFDLLADRSPVPGFFDDFCVTVAAAKGFVYFCPSALVAGHARAVEARAHRRHDASLAKPFVAKR